MMRLMVCVVLLVGARAWGQAYCALRDPMHDIYEMFPSATAYKTVVRTVDIDARATVDELVPVPLHVNELGRHSLYFAAKEGAPIGVVHVRSELSEWGLVEVAWALDLDLRVVDFAFQRCRSSGRDVLERAEFGDRLRGRSLEGLLELVTADAGAIRADRLAVDESAASLAAVVLRCGIKTIAVTGVVWEADLRAARTLAMAHGAFENPASVSVIDEPYTDDVVARLNARVGTDSAVVDRAGVELARVKDGRSGTLGFVARSEWMVTARPLELWWALGPDGRILRVRATGGWPDEEVGSSFEELIGGELIEHECSAPSDLAALEITILASHHGRDAR